CRAVLSGFSPLSNGKEVELVRWLEHRGCWECRYPLAAPGTPTLLVPQGCLREHCLATTGCQGAVVQPLDGEPVALLQHALPDLPIKPARGPPGSLLGFLRRAETNSK
ncbi:unnamed protein product, partial [Polarella glacialis]